MGGDYRHPAGVDQIGDLRLWVVAGGRRRGADWKTYMGQTGQTSQQQQRRPQSHGHIPRPHDEDVDGGVLSDEFFTRVER